MRIIELHIENFRSIRELHLTGLGPFVVLYGENGAGKSNIMDALAVFAFCVSRPVGMPQLPQMPSFARGELHFDDVAAQFPSVATSLHARASKHVVSIRAVIEASASAQREAYPLDCEVRIEFAGVGRPTVEIRWHVPYEDRERHTEYHQLFGSFDHAFFPVRASRTQPSRPSSAANVLDALRSGHLAQALVLAQTSPHGRTREQLQRLRRVLGGAPLNRPPFAPVHDPATGLYEIQEELGDGALVSLQRAGLGVEQLYSVLAQIVVSGCSIATLEEPEAHLHAPTTGRDLRDVLAHMVNSGELDQLWVATHSNLFDLDPDGYYDVRLDDPEAGTVVERRPLSDIDARHLYEPGPAKHALQGVLSYVPADTVFFRRPDGTPVTAPELLELLQRDDPLAVEFLRAVHGAAVRSVQVQSKFGKTPK